MNEKMLLRVSFAILVGIIGYAGYSTMFTSTAKPVVTEVKQPISLATSSEPILDKRLIEEARFSTTTSPFNTQSWSAVYKNEAYGFTLTFPETWIGYRTKEIRNGIEFGVEDQDVVFSIIVYTTEAWNQAKIASKKSGSPTLPSVIGQNTTHVFTVVRANNFSEKVMPLINTYPSILTTFRLK